MPKAARLGDDHKCPAADWLKPHIGGPILPPCCTSVLIGYKPAARVGDKAFCLGPVDTIRTGSRSVFIGNKKAARVWDRTRHKGIITKGCASVIIGDSGMGGVTTSQGTAMTTARKEAAPFCEISNKRKR